jgi:hypothetical protein
MRALRFVGWCAFGVTIAACSVDPLQATTGSGGGGEGTGAGPGSGGGVTTGTGGAVGSGGAGGGPICTDGDFDGVTDCAGDCDDTDASIYPGAPEICGDGRDQDCDGSDLIDCR